MKKIKLLFVIICFFVAACKSIPEPPQNISRGDYTYAVAYLDWMIKEKMDQYNIPGLAAAVVHDDRVIFSKCYGYADMEKQIPVKGNTVFRAGSISKIFTAQAVLNLIKQGKIDPDADIREYIPDFSLEFYGKKAQTITVKHLLSHTSGLLMDHYAGFTGNEIDTNRSLVKKLKNQPLCFTPGSAFKYSNIGYTLLGMIIEKVTGENFEAYIKGEVLNPLGMNRSSFLHQSRINNNASLAYLGEKGNMAIPHLEIRDKPAAGLYTSLEDMTRFLKQMTSESTLADTMRCQIDSSEEKVDTFYDIKCRYSSGWYIDFYTFSGATNILSGTGFINCFTSEVLLLPDKKIGAVILTNSSLGWKAELEIMAKALKNFSDANTEAVRPEKPGKAMLVNNDISESYEEYYGRYGSFGAVIDIFGKEKKLYARIFEKNVLFLPMGDNSFKPVVPLFLFNIDVSRFSEFDQLLFRFVKNRKKDKFLLMVAVYGESKFLKVFHYIEKKPIPAKFEKYEGTWDVMESNNYEQMLQIYFPGKKLYFSADDGWLSVRFTSWNGEAQLLLNPLDESRAQIVGSGDMIFFNDDNNSLDLLGLVFTKKHK